MVLFVLKFIVWHKNRKKAELLTTGEFRFPHAYQSVPPPLMTYIWYLGSSCSLVAHRRCVKSGREQTFLQLPWRGGIAQFSSLSGLRRNFIVFKIDLIWLLHNILKVACICTPRSAFPCKVAFSSDLRYLCPMLFPFNKFFLLRILLFLFFVTRWFLLDERKAKSAPLKIIAFIVLSF